MGCIMGPSMPLSWRKCSGGAGCLICWIVLALSTNDLLNAGLNDYIHIYIYIYMYISF